MIENIQNEEENIEIIKNMANAKVKSLSRHQWSCQKNVADLPWFTRIFLQHMVQKYKKPTDGERWTPPVAEGAVSWRNMLVATNAMSF